MASSLPIPELTFLRPQTTPKRRLSLSRNSLSKFSLSRISRFNLSLRTRIRAVREEGVVVEDRDRGLIKEVNGAVLNGNGAASTSGSDYRYNGSVDGYESGGVIEVERVKGSSNGSLMKYVNGNGVASEVVEEVEVSESKEKGRQKRIEEIGKEEAWFKRSAQQEVFCFFFFPEQNWYLSLLLLLRVYGILDHF